MTETPEGRPSLGTRAPRAIAILRGCATRALTDIDEPQLSGSARQPGAQHLGTKSIVAFHTAAQRRNQSRAETRRVILDATEALLVEAGEAGFSVRALVERCGYSAPTIYKHFKDKVGLIDALLEQRLGLLARELKRVPLGEDPVENLRALTRAFALFGLRNPTHYQLLMQTREENARVIESAEEARRLMEIPAEMIAGRKWLQLGDLEGFRQAIWTMVHGIVSLRALRPDVQWKEELLDQSIEGMLRGWLIPTELRQTHITRPKSGTTAREQVK